MSGRGRKVGLGVRSGNGQAGGGEHSTGRRRGLAVGPSPLNPVKLEAALLLVLGLLLAAASPGALLPAAYGLGAAAWILARTRRLAGRSRGPR